MKSVKNKLLISMPNMVDPYFAKSVIFICEDDINGTMGIIVNKPISEMKIVSSGIWRPHVQCADVFKNVTSAPTTLIVSDLSAPPHFGS